MMIYIPINSYAVLQSNPNTHYKDGNQKNATAWMSGIRQMEATNGAMGLTEEINSDLTIKEGTESNNIDVHMIRSTEYGAIAILSASGYGNPNTIQSSSIKSTTGNVTGVYYTYDKNNANWYREWVAATSTNGYEGINTRYYDRYERNVPKVGDALDLYWHESAAHYWFTDYVYRNVHGYFGYGNNGAIYERERYYGRGIAVCGVGI